MKKIILLKKKVETKPKKKIEKVHADRENRNIVIPFAYRRMYFNPGGLVAWKSN